jgi:predicted nucleic acid-binding protein
LVGDISADVASLAHEDLVSLRVEIFRTAACASRLWELRSNITAYDAWYVALAVTLGARLATLDTRSSRATGTRCEFVAPPR